VAPRRRRRADRATSALALASGTSAGILLLLMWVDGRRVVELDVPTHTLVLGWLVPLVLAGLALLVPVLATPGPPPRRRGPLSLLRRRRRVVDLTRPVPAARRPLPPSRAVAVVAGGTAALLLVIAVAV
jgi:hypothetical protein